MESVISQSFPKEGGKGQRSNVSASVSTGLGELVQSRELTGSSGALWVRDRLVVYFWMAASLKMPLLVPATFVSTETFDWPGD